MKSLFKTLTVVTLLALSCPVLAADNISVTQGSGTTIKMKDVGSGVEESQVLLSDPSGVSILGTAGTSNSNVVTVQGIASGTSVPISAASLPLPTGASTSALQTTGNTSLASIATNTTGAATGTNVTETHGTIAAGTAASKAEAVGGIYNSSPITLTTGQGSAIQLDANGYAKVNIAAGGGSGGTSVSQGSTTSGQNVSPAGCATTTSSPTNTTAQTNMISCDTTGAVRVNVTSATGVAQGSTTSGQTISPIGCRTLSSTPTDTTAQTNMPTCDTSGRLIVNVGAGGGSGGTSSTFGSAFPGTGTAIGAENSSGMGGVISCDSSVVYDASTSGSTQLVALSSGKTVYVCGYTLFAAGTVNVELDYGTGTACVTSPTKIVPAFQLTTQTGAVDGSPFFRGLKTAASNELCLKTSAGVAVQGIVYYTQF